MPPVAAGSVEAVRWAGVKGVVEVAKAVEMREKEVAVEEAEAKRAA